MEEAVNRKRGILETGGIAAILTAVLWAFLPGLFNGTQAFLGGDYKLQFYPWLLEYQRFLKAGELPFWVSGIHAGFPLVAEGQVGAFYPLNLVLFSLLPFWTAYNASFLIHFLIGGLGAYALARRAYGLHPVSAFLAGLLFMLGSAYAGCFYNLVTLRTLCWFPWLLLVVNARIERPCLRQGIALAGLGVLMLLGGFVQMAFYGFLFGAAYAAIRSYQEGGIWKAAQGIGWFSRWTLAAFLVTLPQLLLTIELAGLSTRTQQGLSFALWRSFNPLAASTLLFPSWAGLVGSQIYIGLLPLALAIAFFCRRGWGKREAALFILIAGAFFLALGKFNPLYVWILKLTGGTAFRVPSKFLFFAAFFLSLAASLEFDRALFGKAASRAGRILAILLGVSILLVLGARALMAGWGPALKGWLEAAVRASVSGNPSHPYDLANYLERFERLWSSMSVQLSLANPGVWAAWAGLAALLGLWTLARRAKGRPQAAAVCLAAAVAIDLYGYSFVGIGFRGNLRPVETVTRPHPLTQYLASTSGPYRVYEFKGPTPVEPNLNLVGGVDQVGAYAPLVARAYHHLLYETGAIDDSLGRRPATLESLRRHLPALRLLNVRYLLSRTPLPEDPAWTVRTTLEGVWVYELKGFLPRAFLKNEGAGTCRFVRYEPGRVELEVRSEHDGLVVLSEFNYPGWRARLDGRPAPIVETDAVLMGVRVPKGIHRLEFRYTPFRWHFLT